MHMYIVYVYMCPCADGGHIGCTLDLPALPQKSWALPAGHAVQLESSRYRLGHVRCQRWRSRSLRPDDLQIGLWDYLVGGFKRFSFSIFFHNIWDTPSHWLSCFSRSLKLPTSYVSNVQPKLVWTWLVSDLHFILGKFCDQIHAW